MLKNNNKILDCSVLINIYSKDDIGLLRDCLLSVLNQTQNPSEILLVSDGPATHEQRILISEIKKLSEIPISLNETEQQTGLWAARNYGLRQLDSEFVALMDADDVMHPNRLEFQLRHLSTNPEIDVLGSSILEIDSVSKEILGFRSAVNTHTEIVNELARLNSIFHPTVLLNRERILEIGGYRDFYLAEDYELWTRLIGAGGKFENLEVPLLGFHLTNSFYARRGGLKFILGEFQLRKQVIQNLNLNWNPTQVIVLISRIIYRIIPKKLRKKIYQTHLRGEYTGKLSFESEFISDVPINLTNYF